MDDSPVWLNHLATIRQADSPEVVREMLAHLDEYDEDTRWRVLSAGLDRLCDLDDPEFESVLLEQSFSLEGLPRHLAHERLARWLKYEAPTHKDNILSQVAAVLGSKDDGREARCTLDGDPYRLSL